MVEFNKMYNIAFCNNVASVILHKSSRKNAKCSDIISINHLINNTNNKKSTDERIMQQFVNVLEKVVFQSLEYNKHLEISVYLNIGKNSNYKNANNKTYKTTERLRLCFHRQKFSSVEQAINFLYSIFCLIYPYNEINLENNVYNSSGVKYLIQKYYKNNIN